jgi:hypothetical protein
MNERNGKKPAQEQRVNTLDGGEGAGGGPIGTAADRVYSTNSTKRPYVVEKKKTSKKASMAEDWSKMRERRHEVEILSAEETSLAWHPAPLPQDVS